MRKINKEKRKSDKEKKTDVEKRSKQTEKNTDIVGVKIGIVHFMIIHLMTIFGRIMFMAMIKNLGKMMKSFGRKEILIGFTIHEEIIIIHKETLKRNKNTGRDNMMKQKESMIKPMKN